MNVGHPLPDPRTAVINDLSAQIDSFFAERDKIAPTVRYLAEEGKTLREAAEALGTDQKRVKLIARENGIKFVGRK